MLCLTDTLGPATLVSVAVQPSDVAEMATKSSPAPLQKHSLGGRTVDRTPTCSCMVAPSN